jgi:hypothetical protein
MLFAIYFSLYFCRYYKTIKLFEEITTGTGTLSKIAAVVSAKT